MKTGKDLVDFSLKYIGAKYVFGVQVPKDNKNWKSPFDCAEFISYCIYQVFGKIFGCYNNAGKPALADAWTNYFKRDIEEGVLTPISVEEAVKTPGAGLLRYTVGSSVGHIAISDGTGRTIEANSTKYGTIRSVATGRRWDTGFLIPGIEYKTGAPVVITQPDIIYRYTSPLMKGDSIKKLQSALKKRGFDPNGVDGYYGAGTMNAVKAFQLSEGLVPDGEAGQEVLKELNVNC